MLLVKDMGFTWIKQGIGWRDVELTKGEFDWEHTDHFINKAQEYGGLKLIARVDNQPNWAREGCSLQGPPQDLQDYADFLTALATRYRGKIAAYQIWNEPNLAREWCDEPPDPVAYAEMLRVAYAALKQADPDALVISAGMAPTAPSRRPRCPTTLS
jgi:GH35 family endo-1,4-beta-xylanase